MLDKIGKFVSYLCGQKNVHSAANTEDASRMANFSFEHSMTSYEDEQKVFEPTILKPVSTELEKVILVLTGISYHSRHRFSGSYPLNFSLSEEEYSVLGNGINPIARFKPQQFPANLMEGVYREKALSYVESIMPEINLNNYHSVLWEMLNYTIDSHRTLPSNMTKSEVAALVLAETMVINHSNNIPLTAVATLVTLANEYSVTTVMSKEMLQVFSVVLENMSTASIPGSTVTSVLDDLLLVATSMLGSITIDISGVYIGLINLITTSHAELNLNPSEIHFILSKLEKLHDNEILDDCVTQKLEQLKKLLLQKSPCLSILNLKI